MKFTKHYDRNYTTVHNEILRDKTVSNAAKGLFLFLWSCSDEFHISLKGLQAVCKDGRDAISGQLKELERAGYLRTVQVKGNNGRFFGINYDLRDTKEMPFDNMPRSDIPCSGFPNTERADTKEVLKEEILNKETTAFNSSSHSSTKGRAPKKEEEKEEKYFQIPTQEEVAEYIAKNGYQTDAFEFWSFYEKRGWKAGPGRIRDWRKCCDAWERSQKVLNKLESFAREYECVWDTFESGFDFEGALKNENGRSYPTADEWSDV